MEESDAGPAKLWWDNPGWAKAEVIKQQLGSPSGYGDMVMWPRESPGKATGPEPQSGEESLRTTANGTEASQGRIFP